jgi:trans-2,3-dihydro-3-hydroxyanthranilate isomerase
LGTAWLLAGGTGTFTLDLAGGAVPVSFAEGVGWMTPPPVSLGGVLDPERTARLIGLVPEQLAAGYPARFAEVGPEFILIGVNDLAALRESALNEDLHQAYQEEGLAVAHVFVFTDDAYGPDADFASRMFFDAGGIREDPATGSANSAFAAYLKDLRGGSFEVVMDQGVEMKRPSRLYLRVGDDLQVGGRTQLIFRGELARGIL